MGWFSCSTVSFGVLWACADASAAPMLRAVQFGTCEFRIGQLLMQLELGMGVE